MTIAECGSETELNLCQWFTDSKLLMQVEDLSLTMAPSKIDISVRITAGDLSARVILADRVASRGICTRYSTIYALMALY